ncbi:elongator complex protein 5 [Schistocerca cancellata]|uniref:elongator complex protein 5 n=1 Tax=Schistocerca cancellata TaxID=274614 RepID=UPI002119B6DE|nr:elongator complex protein 5 [Schistocerca cancellata]
MLLDIITRKLPSRLVVIQDSVENTGICLWKSFVKQATSGPNTVCVLALDNNIARLKPCEGVGILQFFDFFSCEEDWTDSGENSSSTVSLVDKLSHLAASSQGKEFILCIDSLSSFILKSGLNQCYRDLQNILSSSVLNGVSVKQMICLVHEDVLMNRDLTIAQLKHLASTYIQISAVQGKPVATTIHQKTAGKISKSVEQFHINDEFSVSCTKVDFMKKVTSDVQNEPKSTFNLELCAAEKEAKNQLVLPYIRRQDDDESKKSGGEIFYKLEESDDWDEDDPDDDLDV